MSKKAVNMSVRPRGRNDNAMRMIKRFMKKVKKENTKKEKSKGFKKTRRREQNKRQLEIKKLIIR